MSKYHIICLEGNSCEGSFARFSKIQEGNGFCVHVIKYFGVVQSPQEFRDFYLSELVRLGITDPYILVGSSFGGHLAIDIANRYPENVKGLVLTGTPPAGTPENVKEAFIQPIENIGADEVPLLGLLAIERPMLISEAKRFLCAFGWDNFQPCWKSPGIAPQLWDKNIPEMDRECYELNLRNLTTSIEMGKTRKGILSRLSEYGDERQIAIRLLESIPICVIHGELDPVINLEYLQKIFEKVHVIKGSPHYVQWCAPEEFSDIVEKFIRKL